MMLWRVNRYVRKHKVLNEFINIIKEDLNEEYISKLATVMNSYHNEASDADVWTISQ
jgi:hypothetical protein